jgi:hypothetical protein
MKHTWWNEIQDIIAGIPWRYRMWVARRRERKDNR